MEKLELDDFINLLNEVEDKDANVVVERYTTEYSKIESEVVFDIEGKKVVLNRINWYEDSYWTKDVTIDELLEILHDHLEDGDDVYDLTVQMGDSSDEWEWSNCGEKDNGFDLELVSSEIENPDDELESGNIYIDGKFIDLYELHDNYVYDDTESEKSIGDTKSIKLEYGDFYCEITDPDNDSDKEEEEE